MNLISNSKKQEFMWVASYLDGTNLSEFEPNGKENEFYSIKKSQLLDFSLIGLNHSFSFNCLSGMFNIDGRSFGFKYITDKNEVINLSMANFVSYSKGLIQFKEACADFNLLNQGDMKSMIESFNLGYKVNIKHNEVDLHFKIICRITYNQPVYFEIQLTPNKELNGNFIIERNGCNFEIITAPIKKGNAGKLIWQIR